MGKVFVDLSHPFFGDMPLWPYFSKPEIAPMHSMAKGGVLTQTIKCTMHTGTHADAPRHVMETMFDGRRALYSHELPVDAYCGDAVCLDMKVDRWKLITAHDLEDAVANLGEEPFPRRADAPGHPVQLPVGGLEDDAHLPSLGPDGEEALGAGDEILGADAEEGVADRLEHGAFPGAVGPGEHVDPRGKGELRVAVRLYVLHVHGDYAHGAPPPERRPRSSSPSTSPFSTRSRMASESRTSSASLPW